MPITGRGNSLKLSLGPILYYWSLDQVRAFYEEAAHLPVDIVYLGETVCAKRRAIKTEDWLALADTLATAGKEVVLSTLALVEAESELSNMRRMIENGRYSVEANDMAAVNIVTDLSAAAEVLPFVAGPHINTYNLETLRLLAELGAKRWVPPVEFDRATLEAMQQGRPEGMETEVFAYGRLPLAFSARCFTARAHNLPKDDCEFRCLDFPDGMLLRTQEQKPFLNLNGIQVQSAGTYNLITQVHDLAGLDVDVLRLSPQPEGMAAVVELFRNVLDGRTDANAAAERLLPYIHDGPCDGYWRGGPGMAWGGL